MQEECLICNAPLEYLENDELMECVLCHKIENSKTRCRNQHRDVCINYLQIHAVSGGAVWFIHCCCNRICWGKFWHPNAKIGDCVQAFIEK